MESSWNRRSVQGRGIAYAGSVLLLSLLHVGPVFSGETRVDLQALVQECQRVSQSSGAIELVWWLPEEFWMASMAQGALPASQGDEILKVIRPYVLIAALSGEMGPLGGISYRSESDMRAGIVLRGKDGNAYGPLTDDKMSPDMRNLISILRPVISNMMGQMGQNLHFFVFPSGSKKGEPIADADQEGSFTVSMGGTEYRWRLPLGSVLPPRTCPTCGERLSGAYKFCPWDGTRLQ